MIWHSVNFFFWQLKLLYFDSILNSKRRFTATHSILYYSEALEGACRSGKTKRGMAVRLAKASEFWPHWWVGFCLMCSLSHSSEKNAMHSICSCHCLAFVQRIVRDVSTNCVISGISRKELWNKWAPFGLFKGTALWAVIGAVHFISMCLEIKWYGLQSTQL